MVDLFLSHDATNLQLFMGQIGYCFILLGALILTASIVPLWQLVQRLPKGKIQASWISLIILIILFIFGYIAYAQHLTAYDHIQDLSVPIIFFSGAVFVFVVSLLSLKTANDVMQVNTLQQENITDPLMQIFNRRYLDKRLRQEFESSRRFCQSLSIALIDIDHFKSINDNYGHQVGDLVLQKLAKTIQHALRDSDIIARFGGEELVAILPKTNSSNALLLAERLRIAIEKANIQIPNECGQGMRTIKVTASLGVATLNTSMKSCEYLIECADRALYKAKETGRNRVVTCGQVINHMSNKQLVTATAKTSDKNSELEYSSTS